MKRIFYNIKPTVLISLPFACCAFLCYVHPEETKYWLSLIFIGLVFGYIVLAYLFSWRAYDDKSYQYLFLSKKHIFLWKDVDFMFPITGNYAVTIRFKNSEESHFLRLASYATKDYLGVLREIINYIQIEKPEIKIEHAILKQIESPPKHYF